MHRISLEVFALLLYQTACSLTFGVSVWSLTPDYRVAASAPLSSDLTQTWFLAWTSVPSNFNTFVSSSSIPYQMSAGVGLKIGFTITTAGSYSIKIVTDSSLSTYTAGFSIAKDSTFYDQQPSGTSTFYFVDTYSTGPNSIFLWADSLTTITSISIDILGSSTLNMNILVTSYPALSYVTLSTDFVRADGYFPSTYGISALLALKTPVSDSCWGNTNMPNNPYAFALYSAGTNFVSLVTAYNYSIIDSSSPYIQTSYTNNLVFLIENMQIDCMVDISVTLPTFLNINTMEIVTVTPVIDIVYKFEQDIIDINLQYKLLYFIPVGYGTNGILKISFWKMFRNPHLHFADINRQFHILIDGVSHSIGWIADAQYSPTQYQTQFYIYNSTPIIDNGGTSISTIDFDLPTDYFRTPENSLLHFNNFTVWNLGMQYMMPSTKVNVTMVYYSDLQIISINYTELYANYVGLTHSQWIAIYQNIFIDSVKVSTSLLSFGSTSDGHVVVNVGTPYVNGSSVMVKMCIGWVCVDGRGYRTNFIELAGTFPSYVLFQNSTQAAGQSSGGNTVFGGQANLGIDFNVELIYSIIIRVFASEKLALFSYLINSFFAFKNLAFLYHFLHFKMPINYYRNKISQTQNMMSQQVDLTTLMNIYLGTNITIQTQNKQNDPLLKFPIHTNTNRFGDFDYYNSFVENNFDGITAVTIAIIKLLLIKLLSFIPFLSNILSRPLSIWKQILLVELIAMSPQTVVLLFLHIQQCFPLFFAVFSDKANYIGTVILLLVCVFSVLLFFLFNVFQDRQNETKKITEIKQDEQNLNYSSYTTDRKILKKRAFKRKKQCINKQQYLLLIDNSMYIVIPVFTAFGNIHTFILFMTVLTFYRFYYVIKIRKQLQSFVFVKQLSNKILWLLFNLVYVSYWALEISNYQCEKNSICISILKIFDFGETVLFLGACVIELLLCLVQFLIDIADTIKQIYNKHKKNTNSVANQNLKKNKTIFKFSNQRKKSVIFISEIQNKQNLCKNLYKGSKGAFFSSMKLTNGSEKTTQKKVFDNFENKKNTQVTKTVANISKDKIKSQKKFKTIFRFPNIQTPANK